jgi:hypothetical protein
LWRAVGCGGGGHYNLADAPGNADDRSTTMHMSKFRHVLRATPQWNRLSYSLEIRANFSFCLARNAYTCIVEPMEDLSLVFTGISPPRIGRSIDAVEVG